MGIRQLNSLIEQAIADRKRYADRWDRAERMRLEPKGDQRPAFAGAPVGEEPLVDDNVRQVTSAEMSILWSARTLAVFMPADAAAVALKRQAEAGFDTLLRLTLRTRVKIENILDGKNERGLHYAKFRTRVQDGDTWPDFDPLHPADVVFPVACRDLQEADWICHQRMFTRRELIAEAQASGWNMGVVAQILGPARDGGEGGSGDVTQPEEVRERVRLDAQAEEGSDSLYLVREVYYWREPEGSTQKTEGMDGAKGTEGKAGGMDEVERELAEGLKEALGTGDGTMPLVWQAQGLRPGHGLGDAGGTPALRMGMGDGGEVAGAVETDEVSFKREVAARKWRTVFCTAALDRPLAEAEWAWPGAVLVPGVFDEYGREVSKPVIGPGEPKRWPFVAFRFENRNLQVLDVRGIGNLLDHEQALAAANETLKGIWMAYASKPFLSGSSVQSMTDFRWRPGEMLPQGVSFAQLPAMPVNFDYNVDLARAAASRRVGNPQGALSSADRSRDTKTATEVSQSARQSNLFSSDAVERFTEPLSELFGMMWEWLQHHPPSRFYAVRRDRAEEVSPAVFQARFVVLAGPSGKTANPDLVLRQLQGMAQLMAAFPQMGQFLNGAALAQFAWDQIDPRVTDALVVDPAMAGPNGGAPIEQQVAQIGATVFGHGAQGRQPAQPGLVQQVQAQGQYLTAMAQDEVKAGGEGKP